MMDDNYTREKTASSRDEWLFGNTLKDGIFTARVTLNLAKSSGIHGLPFELNGKQILSLKAGIREDLLRGVFKRFTSNGKELSKLVGQYKGLRGINFRTFVLKQINPHLDTRSLGYFSQNTKRFNEFLQKMSSTNKMLGSLLWLGRGLSLCSEINNICNENGNNAIRLDQLISVTATHYLSWQVIERASSFIVCRLLPIALPSLGIPGSIAVQLGSMFLMSSYAQPIRHVLQQTVVDPVINTGRIVVNWGRSIVYPQTSQDALLPIYRLNASPIVRYYDTSQVLSPNFSSTFSGSIDAVNFWCGQHDDALYSSDMVSNLYSPWDLTREVQASLNPLPTANLVFRDPFAYSEHQRHLVFNPIEQQIIDKYRPTDDDPLDLTHELPVVAYKGERARVTLGFNERGQPSINTRVSLDNEAQSLGGAAALAGFFAVSAYLKDKRERERYVQSLPPMEQQLYVWNDSQERLKAAHSDALLSSYSFTDNFLDTRDIQDQQLDKVLSSFKRDKDEHFSKILAYEMKHHRSLTLTALQTMSIDEGRQDIVKRFYTTMQQRERALLSYHDDHQSGMVTKCGNVLRGMDPNHPLSFFADAESNKARDPIGAYQSAQQAVANARNHEEQQFFTLYAYQRLVETSESLSNDAGKIEHFVLQQSRQARLQIACSCLKNTAKELGVDIDRSLLAAKLFKSVLDDPNASTDEQKYASGNLAFITQLREKILLDDLKQQDIMAAKQDIDILTRINPNNPSVCYAQAELLKSTDYRAAEQAAKKAADFARNQDEKQFFDIYFCRTLIESGHVLSADESSMVLKLLSGKDNQLRLGVAALCVGSVTEESEQGRNRLAIDIFDSVINDSAASNTERSQACMSAATIHLGNNENQAALVYLKIADTEEKPLESYDVNLLRFVGDQLFATGSFEESREYLSRYLDKVPNDKQAKFNRGMAHLRLESLDAARDDFLKLVDDATSSNDIIADANSHLARIWLLKGKQNLAIRRLEKALFAEPDNQDANNLLGDIRFSQSRFEQARQHYMRLIKTDNKNPSARAKVAMALVELGEKNRALKLLKNKKYTINDEKLRLEQQQQDAAVLTCVNCQNQLKRNELVGQAIALFTRTANRSEWGKDNKYLQDAFNVVGFVCDSGIKEIAVHRFQRTIVQKAITAQNKVFGSNGGAPNKMGHQQKLDLACAFVGSVVSYASQSKRTQEFAKKHEKKLQTVSTGTQIVSSASSLWTLGRYSKKGLKELKSAYPVLKTKGLRAFYKQGRVGFTSLTGAATIFLSLADMGFDYWVRDKSRNKEEITDEPYIHLMRSVTKTSSSLDATVVVGGLLYLVSFPVAVFGSSIYVLGRMYYSGTQSDYEIKLTNTSTFIARGEFRQALSCLSGIERYTDFVDQKEHYFNSSQLCFFYQAKIICYINLDDFQDAVENFSYFEQYMEKDYDSQYFLLKCKVVCYSALFSYDEATQCLHAFKKHVRENTASNDRSREIDQLTLQYHMKFISWFAGREDYALLLQHIDGCLEMVDYLQLEELGEFKSDCVQQKLKLHIYYMKLHHDKTQFIEMGEHLSCYCSTLLQYIDFIEKDVWCQLILAVLLEFKSGHKILELVEQFKPILQEALILEFYRMEANLLLYQDGKRCVELDNDEPDESANYLMHIDESADVLIQHNECLVAAYQRKGLVHYERMQLYACVINLEKALAIYDSNRSTNADDDLSRGLTDNIVEITKKMDEYHQQLVDKLSQTQVDFHNNINEVCANISEQVKAITRQVTVSDSNLSDFYEHWKQINSRMKDVNISLNVWKKYVDESSRSIESLRLTLTPKQCDVFQETCLRFLSEIGSVKDHVFRLSAEIGNIEKRFYHEAISLLNAEQLNSLPQYPALQKDCNVSDILYSGMMLFPASNRDTRSDEVIVDYDSPNNSLGNQ